MEPFGIDESWLDVTGSLHLFGGDPVALADRLRERMRGELGLTISVGVSFNKVFAKLGSDYKKPDATTCITPENFRDMVWPLPVTDLLFVGKAAGRTLEKFGVHTIGELARFDREALYTLWGRPGAQLHDFANGLDRSPVAPADEYTPAQVGGQWANLPEKSPGWEEIRAGIASSPTRWPPACAAGMKCSGIALTVRDPDFRDVSRQKQLDRPTNLSRELARAAMDLADQLWNMSLPVRALTVTAIYLVPEDEAVAQQDLFAGAEEEKRQRLEQLDRAMDAIRDKYGKGAIGRASTPKRMDRKRHAPPPGGAYHPK